MAFFSRDFARRAGWNDRFSVKFVCFAVVASLQTPGMCADDDLASRLKPLIARHKGKVAVAVRHLVTGETFHYRENEPMPTASLIKFPVMVEAQRMHNTLQQNL